MGKIILGIVNLVLISLLIFFSVKVRYLNINKIFILYVYIKIKKIFIFILFFLYLFISKLNI